jgi:hypothetical protein
MMLGKPDPDRGRNDDWHATVRQLQCSPVADLGAEYIIDACGEMRPVLLCGRNRQKNDGSVIRTMT